jgi:hypothetical protein
MQTVQVKGLECKGCHYQFIPPSSGCGGQGGHATILALNNLLLPPSSAFDDTRYDGPDQSGLCRKCRYATRIGLYQHYKGGHYEVVGISENTETGNLYVTARNIEHNKLWSRPVEEWLRPLDPDRPDNIPGIIRFKYLGFSKG